MDDREGGMMPSGKAAIPLRLAWRRIFRNGSLLGLILWTHLLLFFVLVSLRAQVPDGDRVRLRSQDVMQARLLVTPHTIHDNSSNHEAESLRTLVRGIRRVPAARPEPRDIPMTDSVPADTANDVPVAPTYPPEASDDFGDPTLRKALHGTTSTRPPLPGGDDGPMAGKFQVIPPRSLEDRVKSMGNYMNCSIVEMARNRPGQLNVVRIADAYTALGCKK